MPRAPAGLCYFLFVCFVLLLDSGSCYVAQTLSNPKLSVPNSCWLLEVGKNQLEPQRLRAGLSWAEKGIQGQGQAGCVLRRESPGEESLALN